MFAVVPGFLTGLSLIVAIGAQNAFVIRQGLTRQHIFLTVLFCSLADALLIAAGIGGLGLAIKQAPMLLEVIRWFGVLYLLWFAVKSFRNAFKTERLETGAAKSVSEKQVVLSLAGFTFLNPHVYLDTVIFVGSIGNQFGEAKWFFALGAMAASFVWFFSIDHLKTIPS